MKTVMVKFSVLKSHSPNPTHNSLFNLPVFFIKIKLLRGYNNLNSKWFSLWCFTFF